MLINHTYFHQQYDAHWKSENLLGPKQQQKKNNIHMKSTADVYLYLIHNNQQQKNTVFLHYDRDLHNTYTT